MTTTHNRRHTVISLILSLLLLLSACTSTKAPTEASSEPPASTEAESPSPVAPIAPSKPAEQLQSIAMGKSQGVFYEIFVRSFYDSNGDGIGDFNGIVQKLDYLADLGIEGIWLMPINPSPTYHGYDVTDYYDVNPDYGTLEDFKVLLAEAKKRKIKIIMDLVVNHSSNQHPWFIESAKSIDNEKRDWYIWASDNELDTSTAGAWGQKPWQGLGDDPYLGIFWEGMPDLNMDNPDVRAEFTKIGQYWLKLGVDGFRLDAAKHLYEDLKSDVGNADSAKKNHAFWQEFRQGLNEVNPDAYLVGEVWDSAAVIGPYLNQALNSAFQFDAAGKIISSVRSEKASDFGFDLSRVYEYYSKQSEGKFVDAPFLTNHDQNRVMTELKGNVDHAKMAASILLTLPGNPFMYYGEEIGMKGAKPDERIREPMIWSGDSTAKGQTNWELSLYREGVVPVDQQLKDSNSLLNHYKTLISWRKQSDILQQGSILSYRTDNKQVMTYLRVYGDKRVLVVHNLTGQQQSATLKEETAGAFTKVLQSSKPDVSLNQGKLELPPYSSAIIE